MLLCRTSVRAWQPQQRLHARMFKLLLPTSGVAPLTCAPRALCPVRQSTRLHSVRTYCSKHQVKPSHAPDTATRQTVLPVLNLQLALLLAWGSIGFSGSSLAADAANSVEPYVPGPVSIGWEVWAGAIAGVIPFIIGAYQFTARILIQRRCETCKGSGLVQQGRFQRKCPECGGFFPWQGWKQFLTSTAAPGNGGVLRQPRDQKGVIYRIPAKKPDQEAPDQSQ